VSAKQSVNVGIVGLGRFGKLHARILTTLAGVNVVAATDPSPEAQAWAREVGIDTVYDTFAEILKHPDLDALFLISPEDLHAEQAMPALDLGIPIFMEKPLSTTIEGAQAIVQKANAAGISMQIGFVLRFDAQSATVKQAIDNPDFGRVVLFHAKRNCSADWFPSYGERAHVAFETMIHDIDLMLWFTGSRAKSVYAIQQHVAGLANPDALMAQIQLENGVLVQLETSWLIPASAPRNVMAGDWVGTIDAAFEVIGSKSTATYRLLESGVAITSSQPVYCPDLGMWPEIYGQVGGALRAEDAHFIECVRTGVPSEIASLADALHGLEIANAIRESANSGEIIRFG